MAFLDFKYFTKSICIILWIHGGKAEVTDNAILPVIPPRFTEMAEEAGLPCEEVQITTEDGYILDMFHIPGNESHPVFLQSGNLGTSDDYITRGKTSLPYILWSAGYDVWVGNIRGCRYGRRHVTLNPDLDDEFWKFSFNEFAVYDTPAMIDYILNRTQASTLSSIGWSYGTTVNYLTAAERPEYNDKIDVIISLAPICYLHHSLPLDCIKPLIPGFDLDVTATDQNEILGEHSTALALLRRTCSTPQMAFEVCMPTISLVVGADPEQLEPEFAAKFFQHYPSSTSKQNEMHEAQTLETKRFAQYDYGPEENHIRYGSPTPREYDLSKNTVKIVLISGKNDQTSTLADVDLLKTQLPNIVDDIILEPESFNHIDFVGGRDTHKVLYEPIVLDILKKYNNKNCET